MTLTARDIQHLLGLKPHPTCGFVAETYRSPLRVPAAALPSAYGSDRPMGSALYFLVTPDAHVKLHRIRSDQQYHHHLGDPLSVLLLYADGSAASHVVGTDLAGGQRPMLFIPGGTFHTARLAEGGSFALLASTEWPGVEPADVELGDWERILMAFPDQRATLEHFKG